MSPLRRTALLALLLLAVLAGAAWWASRPSRDRPLAATLSVAEALRGEDGAEGFARAVGPRQFSFPADHGPHPEFRTEWWYFTGNLRAPGGRPFGFQLTFFRNALVPSPAPRTSAWAASQVYLAHFALTDVAERRFRDFERFSRGALGLAGAQAAPLRVWVEDWSAASAGAGTWPLGLLASQDGISIDLRLERGKPPVLQGDRGLSRKGGAAGNASYYYSLTRMPARGTVRVGGESFPVSGLAWMDREWSTSSLAPGQVGWDWFALQLDDGRELMLYQLRRTGGVADPASSGSLIAADGTKRHLSSGDFRLQPRGTWESPRSGARYPARWRVTVPTAALDLEVRPLLADQELDATFRYWEGAVEVTGRSHGRPVRGAGYLEMTGYADRAPDSIPR